MARIKKLAYFLAILIIVFGIALLIIVQSGLKDRIRDSAVTKTAEFATVSSQGTANVQTSTVLAYQTNIAPTQIRIPTHTPNLIGCVATLVGGERYIYKQPSRGLSEGRILLSEKIKVMMYSRLDDISWLPVEFNGQTGWIRRDFISFDPECVEKITPSKLSDLLVIPDKYNALINDTFWGSKEWEDLEERIVTRQKLGENEDWALEIRAPNKVVSAKVRQSVPVRVTNFELQTSFIATYSDANGYFGIRFRVNQNRNSYFETRVYYDCSVEVYKIFQGQEELIATHPITSNSCHSGVENYVRLYVKDNTLSGDINDTFIPETQLPDPSGQLVTGDFEVIAYKEVANVYFVLLTAPE